jgi:3-hydroxybutyrate dehydrogenase
MRTPMVENQLAEQMRLHARSREEVIESMVDRHPVKRFVELDEVANTIAFLASDQASGINGSFIPVDLGTLAC